MTTTINLLANNPSSQRVGLKRVQVGDSGYRVPGAAQPAAQEGHPDFGERRRCGGGRPGPDAGPGTARRGATASRLDYPTAGGKKTGAGTAALGVRRKAALPGAQRGIGSGGGRKYGFGRPEILLDGNLLRVAVPGRPTGAESQERVREAVTAWYLARADEQVQDEVERWWPALGNGDYPRIYIRNQRRRWGSCARDGALRFNWRLAMLEPSLTEYVVVHELAHRTHMNHSADFWNLVAAYLPDVKERRQRLKAAGAVLPPL